MEDNVTFSNKPPTTTSFVNLKSVNGVIIENEQLKNRIFELVEINKNWQIKDVYFNPPYVTVKWRDDSVSHSKQNKADEFDPLIGFMIAVGNHMFPNRDVRNKIFEKYWKRYVNKS